MENYVIQSNYDLDDYKKFVTSWLPNSEKFWVHADPDILSGLIDYSIGAEDTDK